MRNVRRLESPHIEYACVSCGETTKMHIDNGRFVALCETCYTAYKTMSMLSMLADDVVRIKEEARG